jgi:hypothetical protein
MAIIESDVSVVYAGTMQAQTFEIGEVEPATSRLIRSDQEWYIEVNWRMEHTLVAWLAGEFQLKAYLESMGPGAEYAITGPTLGTLSVPLLPGPAREYTAKIEFNPGDVSPGVYKLVTALQLYQVGLPKPVAGFVEGPVIEIFKV